MYSTGTRIVVAVIEICEICLSYINTLSDLLTFISFYQIFVIKDILHMSFLAGTHVFKTFPAYTTTEI